MGSASARGWSGWSARSPMYHNPLDLLGECVIHSNSPESHVKCYSSSQAAAESSPMDLAVFSARVILCEMLQLNWELLYLPESPHVSSAVRPFPFTPGGGLWMFQPEEVRGPKFFPFRMTAWLWVVLFPSCNRRALLSKAFTLKRGIWFPSVQKCLMSCWPQTPTSCKVWCFSCFWRPAPDAFRHEQPSVGNPLRHQAPPLTEVKNQEVPL